MNGLHAALGDVDSTLSHVRVGWWRDRSSITTRTREHEAGEFSIVPEAVAVIGGARLGNAGVDADTRNEFRSSGCRMSTKHDHRKARNGARRV